jgi:hypothetical protein
MPIFSNTGSMIPSMLQAPDLPANVLEFDDDALLDIVQRQTAWYFWEGAHPVSGLARDRQKTTAAPANDLVAIGGSGFGIMAIIVAVERGWIDRTAALSRLQRMLDFLESSPACNFQLFDEIDVTNSPIREFHGAADDWTLEAPCRDYMDRLAAAGHDAEMVEYPGARHSFDNPQAPALNVRTEEQTSRNCRRHEVGGRLINADTGQPFTYKDACVEYGPTVQYDSAATEAAKGAVKKLLTGVFHLN